MVVGAAPVVQSKKSLALAKKLASAPPLPSSKGVDPAATTVEKKVVVQVQDAGDGRPDKAAYDREQDQLRLEIDALQLKSNEIKNRIAATSGKGPNQERKVQLRAELDSLRGDQARIKGGRGKTLDQVKAMQEGVAKKIKELQAAKAKLPYKSAAEVDAAIQNLDRQVSSGLMKLVDEKKALMEMSSLKKTRKTVESFGAQQAAIDADKKRVDEIRAGLDDPEAKAISDRFNAARTELDQINKAHDEANKGRDGLFEERNAISKELDGVFTKKKESANAFREANNKFYQKMNDDRAKRLERQRSERQQFEDQKRSEVNERLLEEAQAPAFEREIEDCRTLVDFFQRRIGLVPTYSSSGTSSLFAKNVVAGVPKLELRTVETGPPAGAVALKKKGTEEEVFFMGGGGKKGKKGPKPAPAGAAAAEEPVKEAKDQPLNLPFPTLSALLSLGITSPLTVVDVPTTIEALEVKKKYFTDNQARVTKEKIAAVEKKIAAADKKSAAHANGNGNGDAIDEAAAATPTAVETKAAEEEAKVEEPKVEETKAEEAPVVADA
ncbi:hypothetical protein RQP46_003724 [Phenoliferia psychrophenolica]